MAAKNLPNFLMIMGSMMK